MRDGVVKFK
jgi:predicted DNA-binding ribbon-helix-helix protein